MKFSALLLALTLFPAAAQSHRLTRAGYEDRVHAAWLGQILGTLMGFAFEHKPAAVEWVDRVPDRFAVAPVDDDYYYELVALRAIEKYGPGLTVRQLGEQWRANNAGTWGSSKLARELLARGIQPPDTGHPRYNPLWFSIGPQFSGDIYGMIAPGMPNLAGRLARELGHINGFAEGTDGAVFVAGMVSLAFVESDPREVVRQAARLIHPSSPYRQAIDQVIALSASGASAQQVADAVEDRWHVEYPATNNAVANGALIAVSVFHGEGDFLKTLNLAFSAADFTDADCNAANAGAVIGAMKGMRGIPAALAVRLQDRMRGGEMGGLPVVPPVDESISEQARRIAAAGVAMLNANGAKADGSGLAIPRQPVQTQAAELFHLGELMKYWNPEWTMRRAGVGGAGGGMAGIRGNTYLDGETLATYPRDEVRGVVIERQVTLSAQPRLRVDVAVDPARAWQLEVCAGNEQVFRKLVENPGGVREWQSVEIPLSAHAGKSVRLRLIQRALVPGKNGGNAYWRNLRLE
jgi:hypothetical protein